MFELKEVDIEALVSQSVIPSKSYFGGAAPYAFTEQGVSMLSAVIKTPVAVGISVKLIRAFVDMRKFIANNAAVFQRLDQVEKKQLVTDDKLEQILNAIESNELKPKQGLFYDGQIFDAYKLVADIIRTAEESIVVIDNYIDDTTLQLFTKSSPGVMIKFYTKKISKILQQDVAKFNQQYRKIEVLKLQTAHDRFMIIDEKSVYHFGASLKDLGKKWFVFSKLEMNAKDILKKL